MINDKDLKTIKKSIEIPKFNNINEAIEFTLKEVCDLLNERNQDLKKAFNKIIEIQEKRYQRRRGPDVFLAQELGPDIPDGHHQQGAVGDRGM